MSVRCSRSDKAGDLVKYLEDYMFAESVRSPRVCLSLIVLVFVFFSSAALADELEPDQGASVLTPEKIYLRSIRAMREVPEPAFVMFRETVLGRNVTLQCTKDGIKLSVHHGDVREAYAVWFRTSDGSALSRAVNDARAETCPDTLLAPAGSVISSLGVTQASPSPGTALPTALPDSHIGPPIIGAVHVYAARFYHIELAGLEQLGGNDVYHLKLRAYRDPDTHPLTDLYVDRKTFLVRKARGNVAGHYVIASGRIAGVIDFDRVGPYWLAQHEHFDVTANALFVHARMTLSIDGSEFATPNELPDNGFRTRQSTAWPKAMSVTTASGQ